MSACTQPNNLNCGSIAPAEAKALAQKLWAGSSNLYISDTSGSGPGKHGDKHFGASPSSQFLDSSWSLHKLFMIALHFEKDVRDEVKTEKNRR